MRIDLNCDLGESFGCYRLADDEAMLQVATSANVACGLHAGDPLVMARTVTLAAREGVAVGAHPGYPDLQGFGRRAMALSPEDLEAFLVYQIGALAAFARAANVSLAHVKPHGALYNAAMRDADLAGAVARAVASFDRDLIVVAQPGSALVQEARAVGLKVAHEGFADRAYRPDGTLVPRGESGAVIHDPAEAVRRAVRMVTQGQVDTIEGRVIPVQLDTLCVHGDTPGAARIAADLRTALTAAGVQVVPMVEVIQR
jgi:UPF0271 protein